MESRVLMSAFTYAELADRFNLPDQILNLQVPGGVEYQGFGHAATGLGDIDGDGFSDFAVSAPGTAFGAETPVAGAVFIFSGHTGFLINTISDGSAGFGSSLADIGDVNGDGIHDLLVGSPKFDNDGDATPNQYGRAWIYSGADASQIRSITGAGASDEFGFAVALIGDLNADGVNDFGVGAPGAGAGGEGQVTIYSGSDGAVIYTFTGEAAGHRFGAALIGAGNLGAANGESGDGIGDILIGAPGSDAAAQFAGKVYFYDGAAGTLRWSAEGQNLGDGFGTALGVTFVNPGLAIVYVGTPGFDAGSGEGTLTDAGRVYRYNQDGTLRTDLGTWEGSSAGAHYGQSITMVGDIDGDGAGDMAFMAPGAAEGQRVYFFQGGNAQSGSIAIPQAAQGRIGDAAFGIGDIDNDGFADVGSGFASGDHFLAVSSLAVVPPSVFQVGSDNLAYLFTSDATGRSFAIINGRIMAFDRVPGLLRTDQVLGVNNSGDIVVRSEVEGASGLYIIRGGMRTLLQDSFNTVPTDPAPIFDAFQFVRIGNGGDIIFNDVDSSGDQGAVTRSWLLREHTLAFLWAGEARDVNATGQILGVRDTDSGRVVVLRSADGASEQTVGLTDAWRVNDNGLVVGVNADGDLATWMDGATTVIGDLPLPDGAASAQWIVRGVNNDGRVLATYQTSTADPQPVITQTDYIFVPGDGLARISDVTFDVDAGEDPRADRALLLGADGTILSHQGAFSPIANDAPWVGRNGTPLWASSGAGALVVAGVNQYGDAVLLRLVGDSWHGSRLDIDGLGSLDSLVITQTLTYTSDTTGWTHVFLLTSQGGYFAVHTTGDPATIAALRLNGGEGSTQIVDHATVFASADHRIHLAGTDASGDLVIYFQNNPDAPGEFFFDNLTATHIESQGMTFHAVASNVTVLVTQWGASHLFYLDDAGSLYSVWIAEGMTYWTSTDISANLANGNVVDNPELALSGQLTAYGTPWGGLNIVGSSPDGDPTAIWWVPGFGGTWRHEKIYGNEGQTPIAFNPNSTASYTTPWGGLNVATVQENGDVAVFWWVPGFDSWRGEVLTIGQRPDGLTFTGDITATVMGDNLNLFVRGNDGDLYRLFWNPGDEGTWNLENLTESVA